jgi:sugar-phosphatase
MIEAVIFDMDGVIIDSEPLWAEAQKEVFTSIGVDYSEELALKTVGTGTYDTIDFWYRQQPWEGLSFQEVSERIFERMVILIREKGRMIDGLQDVLDFFRKKDIKLALASGSPMFIIQLVLEQLNIRDYFEIIHTVEDEEFGKPHPAVFISVAKKFELLPMHIAVFEDSFNGLIAAKAARMKAVAFLRNGEFNNSRYDFADLKLSSYGQFDETYFNYLQNLI